ncbi:MAG: hypothetical protein IH624_02985 [Phycisphaerae bacterium]|nr:hypothetical protein [Phycisphaerae bacterium]
MKKRSENRTRPCGGFTVWELICILGVIALLFALLMPSLSKVKRISTRVVCGTNLKGLGTAMMVYANDYEDRYPELPGVGPWAKHLGFDYCIERVDFGPGGDQADVGRTVTASWYLLVREADVSPKSFVCPEAPQEPFGGRYLVYNRDIVSMWDFGNDPYRHVSYAMHLPYGRFPAKGNRGAAFAVAGDMSPWFENGDILPPGRDPQPPQLLTDSRSSSLYEGWGHRAANSSNHNHQGQNVLFGDGHSSFEKASDVGIKEDGIYTYWPSAGAGDGEKRVGQNPTARDPENDARAAEDSFLAM